jgi:hypothetical protein
LKVELKHGDSLEVLKSHANNSVDSLVTDPPYGLSREPDIIEVLSHWIAGDDYSHKFKGFMGKDWDSFVPSPSLWKEVFRVMKPGAHGLVFVGTRTVDLMGISLRMAGFEIRDTVFWCYGSGFPKSRNIEKELGEEYRGIGTALKPALEPIIMIRKPLSEKTIAENVMKWGTGGINIDACRVPTQENLNGGAYAKNGGRSKSTVMGQDRTNKEAGMFGQNSTTEGDYKQPEGRWPANLIHDGSEEVKGCFPNSKSCDSPSTARPEGSIFGGRRSQGAIYPGEDGSASRFFYCAKASKKDRNSGGVENKHPTVKPLKLMEYLVKLITPVGGASIRSIYGIGDHGNS